MTLNHCMHLKIRLITISPSKLFFFWRHPCHKICIACNKYFHRQRERERESGEKVDNAICSLVFQRLHRAKNHRKKILDKGWVFTCRPKARWTVAVAGWWYFSVYLMVYIDAQRLWRCLLQSHPTDCHWTWRDVHKCQVAAQHLQNRPKIIHVTRWIRWCVLGQHKSHPPLY